MGSSPTLSRDAHEMAGSEHAAGSRKAIGGYALVCLGAALLFYVHMFHFPFMPIWLDSGDQYFFLDHAVRMLHGEVIYRDFFQFNLPGTDYLYYILFRCFGVRLWLEPLAMFITETAVTLLVYSLSRVVLRGWAAMLPPIAFLVICQRYALDGTHHWYSTLLVLLAIRLIAKSGNPICLGIAGVLLGLATLFTSSRGVFVLAGVSLFLAWKFRPWRGALKSISVLLATFVAVVALALLYLAAVAGPKVLFESVLVFPLRYYSASDANGPAVFFDDWVLAFPVTGFHSIEHLVQWFAVNLAVPIVLMAFVARCFRPNAGDLHSSQRGQTLVLYTFAASFAALAVAGSPSGNRLDCAVSFVYILGTVMLCELGKRRLAGVALALVSAAGMGEIALAGTRPVYKLDAPRGTIALWHRDRYEQFVWLADNARPGDELFGDANFNLVFDLKNPARVEWIEPNGYTRPEQVRDLVMVLKQQHTRFLVWDAGSGNILGPGDNLQPFRTYMKENYHLGHLFPDGTEFFVVNSTSSFGQ